MNRTLTTALLLAGAVALAGCQSTTDPDSSVDADDVIDVSFNPNPVIATTSTGRTYRVVRGNNQPDDILEYDWKATFNVSVTVNGNASDADINFPAKLTSTGVKVQQASGGVVTPPTGSDTEHYESLISSISGSEYSGENTTITMTVEVWYDLPSLKKEALVSLTFGFQDDDGVSFTRVANVQIQP